MLVRIFKVALTLVLADAAFVGCSSTDREHQVDTYEQLQQEVSTVDDVICFPDLSHYEDLDLVYTVFGVDRGQNAKGGYSLVSSPDAGLYEVIAKNSLITDFGFSCADAGSRIAGDNENTDLKPNTSYRGVPIRSFVVTYADIVSESDTRESVRPHTDYFFQASYVLVINGYWYSLDVAVKMSGDKMQTIDIDAETNKAKEEVLMLVDSIFDQNGVSR